MVLLYIACALTISDFEIVSVVTMLIWISIPALAIYIRHDFGHVKSRRQKRPSFLSPQLFHYGCLLYTSPSPRDVEESRMPSSA